MIVMPSLRLSAATPRFRLPLETVSVVAAAFTGAVAYVRYALARQRVWLFISLAFLIIAINQLVFGILVEAKQLGANHGPYFWTSALGFWLACC